MMLPLSQPDRPAPCPRGRAGLIIAWTAIVVVVLFEVFVTATGWPAGEQVDERDDQGASLESAVVDFQLKYIVGASQLTGHNDQMNAVLETLNTGPVPLRQRCIAVVGEVAGPVAAAEETEHLARLLNDHDQTLEGPWAKTQRILERVYPDDPLLDRQEHASLIQAMSVSEQETVVAQLGWAGELLLHPAGGEDAAGRASILQGASMLVGGVVLGMIVAAAAGVVGLVGLILITIFLATGRLRCHMSMMGGGHRVFAEVFALWLIVFIGLQYLLAAVVPEVSVSLAWSLVPFLGSLVVVWWPLVRGIRWHRVQSDIGWTKGAGLAREVACGVAGYIMALPLLAVGMTMTVILMAISGGGGIEGSPFDLPSSPSHPVVEIMLHATPWTVGMIFILASVAAPLVEETMFRGVLYGHLRQAWGGAGVAVSVIGATLFSSLIFAAIHPQGWVTIPALGSLACAFALARQWRGSLVAPMVMHGISNAIVLSIGLVVFGG